LPILNLARITQQRLNQMQQQMNDAQQQNTPRQKPPQPAEGEYIDYEEVK